MSDSREFLVKYDPRTGLEYVMFFLPWGESFYLDHSLGVRNCLCHGHSIASNMSCHRLPKVDSQGFLHLEAPHPSPRCFWTGHESWRRGGGAWSWEESREVIPQGLQSYESVNCPLGSYGPVRDVGPARAVVWGCPWDVCVPEHSRVCIIRAFHSWDVYTN